MKQAGLHTTRLECVKNVWTNSNLLYAEYNTNTGECWGCVTAENIRSDVVWDAEVETLMLPEADCALRCLCKRADEHRSAV